MNQIENAWSLWPSSLANAQKVAGSSPVVNTECSELCSWRIALLALVSTSASSLDNREVHTQIKLLILIYTTVFNLA